MHHHTRRFGYSGVKQVSANGNLGRETKQEQQRRHQRPASDSGQANGKTDQGTGAYIEKQLRLQ